MKQQYTVMKFDPATGEPKPYPSHADQWRGWHGWHGKMEAWLFNPWTGTRRNAGDVGSDTFGQLILPPGEPLFAVAQPDTETSHDTEALYKDFLRRLGTQGHEGAIAEISKLREHAGLEG